MIISWVILKWLKNQKSQLPIDNKRRPFSFDEKARVIEKIVKKYGTAQCEKCRATEDLAIDHIMPLARGGHNGLDNLTLLCKNCNSSKGAN